MIPRSGGPPLGRHGFAPRTRTHPRRRGPRSAADDAQLAGLVVEDDRAVRAADDDVLDPGAVAPREVDPGLDAEGHPGLERLAVAGDEVRLLMALEPDSVTRPVEEVLLVALA